MRNRQIQILYGVSAIQILGLFGISKNREIGTIVAASGTAVLLGYATGLLTKREKKQVCKNCRAIIPKNSRICPECGYCYKEDIAEEKLTEYIEKQKEMTSEQIDHDFERIESVTVDEMLAYDGDIEDFLQNRCNEENF